MVRDALAFQIGSGPAGSELNQTRSQGGEELFKKLVWEELGYYGVLVRYEIFRFKRLSRICANGTDRYYSRGLRLGR